MSDSSEITKLLTTLAERHGRIIRTPQYQQLFDQSAYNTSFYRLSSGTACIQLAYQRSTITVMQLQEAEWFGQPPISASDHYEYAVYCTSDCTFEKVDWNELRADIDEFALASTAFDSLTHKLHTLRLLVQTFYKTYQDITADFLQDLIARGKFVHLEENETLFEQGDDAQVMYFLLSGKIDVYVGGPEKLTRVGEIFHGEPFGEMSLFSGEARTATLVATRTCDLISLDRKNFDLLANEYPKLSTYIVTSLIGRIKKQNERLKKKYRPVNRLLLHFDQDKALDLIRDLKQVGSNSPLNIIERKQVDLRFSERGIQAVTHSQLIDYLDGVEQENSKNLYLAHVADEDWCKICLERSDEVWLICDRKLEPNVITKQLEPFNKLFSWQKQKKVMVSLHEDIAMISNTKSWLESLHPDQHLHVEANCPSSLQRLLRFLTDRSIGIVLGGGGARGFAQIGLLRAFEEAGLEIDWIGGTSIGSIIGGWMAMGLDSQRITDAVKKFFVSVNPLGDYTLPVISLSKSQRLDRLLQQGFGHGAIEDLPIPYFCVSSDMSLAEERHHETGVIWKAIRASISIPGVIAPVIERGHYLVDGGLLNNLPCDLMRQRNNGPIIAIDVSPDENYLTQLSFVPSPWQVLINKLLGRKQYKVPSILETLLRSLMLASTNRQKTNRAIVDLFIQPDVSNIGMLEFKSADRIIEAGYQEGLRMLAENNGSFKIIQKFS